jgi:chemotaxis protein methyltransferase CheR
MTNLSALDKDRLSERDFERLGAVIQHHSGIRMPPAKKTMVEGRLRKRVRALNLDSIHDYCRHIFDGDNLDGELIDLIDVVTTNKTEFFREVAHFDFLIQRALPRLVALPHRPGRDRPLKLWSAACSIGAEPYTLAMALAACADKMGGLRFEIFATDICTDVLKRAKLAIYSPEMMHGVPPEMARRFWRRSRDRDRPSVRLVPEIRQKVRFGHLNLMDDSYPMPPDMDVIFCRNILIYFDKPTQHAVLSKLCRHLRPGGFLFLGHSESLTGRGLPLAQITTSVFQRS